MVTTHFDEKQIEQIAKEFEPEVVRVPVRYGEDFDGEPSVNFYVILSDEAARRERLRVIAREIEERFSEELDVWKSPYFPHFRFRSKSEQNVLKDPSWP